MGWWFFFAFMPLMLIFAENSKTSRPKIRLKHYVSIEIAVYIFFTRVPFDEFECLNLPDFIFKNSFFLYVNSECTFEYLQSDMMNESHIFSLLSCFQIDINTASCLSTSSFGTSLPPNTFLILAFHSAQHVKVNSCKTEARWILLGECRNLTWFEVYLVVVQPNC